MLTTRAPAKINLTLHILGRRQDGYHELESLVAFSGAGDTLSLTLGGALSLDISGPTSSAVGVGDDNLVLRAARRLAEEVKGLRLGRFRLEKRLPVAAGIGGGSSDAAAALRLLAKANALALDDPRICEVARAVGSDVPVCLDPRARMMRGAGESLGQPIRLPPLPAVLINPGVPVATAPVFAALGLRPGASRSGAPRLEIGARPTAEELFAALAIGRNDLEDAACLQAPVIVDALAILRAARGSRLARMSGSGATCFALFATRRDAVRASRVIRAQHPTWWVKTAVLR
ncbi:MAG: 4-(cytidine 5'-diphospho)-2-C-methyl-D-erythritol kinase [Alphaproteobacteria bacterium]|nr:4-(cytidine 5'-diphospho)-2-C-methyl-D-erythritol kinase [Alphaproteobacteria bacterium]